MPRDNLLFYEGDLDATLRSRQGSILSHVDSIPRDQFLNTSIEDSTQHILSTLVLEPLTLYEDRAEMEQLETKIDVSGWKDRKPFFRTARHVGLTVPAKHPQTGEESVFIMRVYMTDDIKIPGSYKNALKAEVRRKLALRGERWAVNWWER